MSESARREIRAALRHIPDLLEIVQRHGDWRTWSDERIAAAIPFAGPEGAAMAEWLAR